jgi:hypothetical protein
MNMLIKRAKRAFHPPRAFDDDLLTFVRLARYENWHFSGVDFEQLGVDAAEQSRQRAEFEAAEARFNALRDEFATAQEARYRRFAMALNAARSVFRCDAIVMSKLERYRRASSRAMTASRQISDPRSGGSAPRSERSIESSRGSSGRKAH